MLIIWHQRKNKISVIIPIYNCDKTNREVESILTQGNDEKKIIRNEFGEVNDCD